MNIYIAGPLFGVADQARNLKLAEELAARGYDIILPQQRALQFYTDGKPDIKAICLDCMKQAMSCDILIANIDGPDADSGTALEVGLALASTCNLMVICVRTDFRTSLENEVGINGMFQLANEIIYMPAFINSLNDEILFYSKLASKINEVIIDITLKRGRK